jgi:hypothetical protein
MDLAPFLRVVRKQHGPFSIKLSDPTKSWQALSARSADSVCRITKSMFEKALEILPGEKFLIFI